MSRPKPPEPQLPDVVYIGVIAGDFQDLPRLWTDERSAADWMDGWRETPTLKRRYVWRLSTDDAQPMELIPPTPPALKPKDTDDGPQPA